MENDSETIITEMDQSFNPKRDGFELQSGSSSTDVHEIWSDPAESTEDLMKLLESFDEHEEQTVNFKKLDDSAYQTTIQQLRQEIQDTRSPLSYLEEFEQVVKNELLYIGSIPIEQLQNEELKLKEECVTNQALQATEQQRRIENLVKLTEQAKERIYFELKRQQKIADRREETLKAQEKIIYERLQKAFRQAENDLRHVLERRKAEVKSFYGHLMFADSQYGGSKGRRWRVEWSKTPQPIQVKLQCVRGIRDKAPPGRYVLMVSLYDRLGGHVLRWSKLTGQQWGGATLPVFHDGSYSSSELSVGQSVFTVLPPQWRVQPGMILAFELFLLRGSVVPVDRVVAWGCFPICDGQFRIVEGFYKLPLIRGHMDHRITKHSTIEKLIATDIDHWIANMYIQIIRLPRYLSGQKEYEVELQFTSGILSYPDRIVDAEEAADGEKVPVQEDGDQFSTSTGSNLMIASGEKAIILDSESSVGEKTAKASSQDAKSSKLPVYKKDKINIEQKMQMEESDEEISDEDNILPVAGQPGISYKIHYKNPVEDYNAKRATTLIPKTPLLNRRVTRPVLTKLEELERHSFSVQPPFSMKGRLRRVGHERAEYVGRMFLSEMGFAQWQTREFWTTILLLVLFWFVRMYVHYCGQWLFLQALRLPVSSFVFFPYTVNLNYQSDLMTTGEEIGIVVLGPISNIIVQILLVLISWISQLVLGTFPLLFSKLILAFSLWVVLDPYAILIVDAILGRYEQSAANPIGDAFKLYWHFLDVEGSGIIGIPMTIFLYLVVTFIAAVVLYLYFLKLHNNGRMLDIFFRLHDDEDCFFMPYDLELSNQELSYIVKKAEQWRGSDGERRKVTVYDYIWDEDPDEFDSNKQQEITTHIAIHTLHLDGLRELYRHFLKLPDGAIVEVFGELGSAHLLPDVKTALLKRANNMENTFGSSLSMDRNITTALAGNSFDSMAHTLQLPVERRDRPVTGDSMKTRETRRDSTDSSGDNDSG